MSAASHVPGAWSIDGHRQGPLDHPPAAAFIKCCGVSVNHKLVREYWQCVGVQCCDGNGPDVLLHNCPSCGSTKGIEVPCTHKEARHAL